MIKVCHMTSAHGPEDVRIFHKECVSLAKAGYDVYLVERGDTYDKNGVHIVGIGEITGGRFHRMTAVAKAVYKKALEIDADIYHFHDPELLPYGLKLKRIGKKVIFDSHENYPKQIMIKKYLPIYFRKVISLLYKKYEEYVLGKIDAVIYPCMENGIHPMVGRCKNCVTIDNYPLLSELYDYYDEKKYVFKEEGALCYIGSLTYERGVSNVVKAIRDVDCKLYLAGRFVSSKYEDDVKQISGWEKVDYVGFLNRSQVREIINRSVIGISTLLNVGQYAEPWNLSTKVYEYISLGIPVILTKNKFDEMTIEKYKFGVCVDPDNINEFSNAIRVLLNNEELRREMGENGRRAVKEVFNWDTQAENLFSLYEELVKELEA